SIILLDAVDYQAREPGDVFLISPRMIPAKKVHDFSLHQFPSVNLLSEIEEYTGIGVTIIAAQMECLPKEVKEGLSSSMEAAVVRACEIITQMLFCQSSISEVTPP
ncbi:MAG TPA: hydrogenase maturation protease, partial [Desulfopila sp.]|nr:hydrogenase maturation protease [Desulfopila sp.]